MKQGKTENYTHQPAKNERLDILYYLLRPSKNRGTLHTPRPVYYQTGGLKKLASDCLLWTGHPGCEVTIVTDKEIENGWSFSVSKQTSTIYIDKDITTRLPFTAAYYTILGCLSVIIKKFSPVAIDRKTHIQFAEHLSIEAGFGLYGFNACFEATKQEPFRVRPNESTLRATSLSNYTEWFTAYCESHRIKLEGYGEYLLPHAQKHLAIAVTTDRYNSFIKQYVSSIKNQRERIILMVLVIAFIATVSVALWPVVPKPLTGNQRAVLNEITTLNDAYYVCEDELRSLVALADRPDILNSRTIQAKAKSCQALRVQHNSLVQEFKRSR